MMRLFDKTAVRRIMRERRKSLSPSDKVAYDSAICKKLIAATQDRSPVAVYLASSDEVDVGSYIASLLDKGVEVLSPRWNGATYDLAKIKGLDEGNLRRGPMGILEPADAELVPPEDVALWVVPGLAFTEDGQRLGYGGGWYDRLMAGASPSAPRIGVAYSFQIVDSLPVEPHDAKLTEVLDET